MLWAAIIAIFKETSDVFLFITFDEWPNVEMDIGTIMWREGEEWTKYLVIAKRWIDCIIKDAMSKKGVSVAMTADRRDWMTKTCADPTRGTCGEKAGKLWWWFYILHNL